MAATNAGDDSAMPPDSWGPQDDQIMGAPGDPQSTGAPLAVGDRNGGQDSENPDYPRGTSISDNETFREKQVKVLRSFLSALCFLLLASFLGLVLQCEAACS